MQLFLTSSIDVTAKDVVTHIKTDPTEMSIVYIDTATELEESRKQWMIDNYTALEEVGFNVTQYSITDKTPEQLAQDLSHFDAFYVEGGNSFYLLDKMNESGFREFIRKQLNLGKPYIGTSAGSIVTGPNIGMMKRADNHLKVPHLHSYEGLHLVNFVIFPHWGHQKFREVYLGQRLDLSYDEPYPYVILHDNQYVLVENDKLQIVEVKEY